MLSQFKDLILALSNIAANWNRRLKAQYRGLFWATIIGALAVLYYRLIRLDPVLDWDDSRMLDPLQLVQSPQDYWRVLQQGKVLDLQPIRDLSLWIDLKCKAIFPWASYHLTNLLIWISILVFVSRILKEIGLTRRLRQTTLALFSVHPIFIDSVAWISARKHLLSTAFILLATVQVVSAARKRELRATSLVLALVCYLGSLWSQPINLLWPIFAICYLKLKWTSCFSHWRVKTLIILSALFGSICAYANFRYYTGFYVVQSARAQKILSGAEDSLGIKLLALGRYFYQVLIPLHPSPVPAFQGAIQNLVGLAMIPLFFLIIKNRSRGESWLWLLYFSLPLALVLAKMTNIFMSDTYLLNASIGLIIPVAFLFENRLVTNRNSSRWTAALPVILFSFLFYQSWNLARAWESDFNLWQYAYQKDPTPYHSARYGWELLRAGKTQEALRLAFEVREKNPHHPQLPLLMSQAIYTADQLSLNEKLELLRETHQDSVWSPYFTAALQVRQSHFDEAFQAIQEATSDLNQLISTADDNLERIAAGYFYICTRAKKQNCNNQLRAIQDVLEEKSYLRVKPWDPIKFSQNLKKLETQNSPPS